MSRFRYAAHAPAAPYPGIGARLGDGDTRLHVLRRPPGRFVARRDRLRRPAFALHGRHRLDHVTELFIVRRHERLRPGNLLQHANEVVHR